VQEGTTRIGEIARDLTTISRSSASVPEIVDVSGAARSALRVTAAQLRQSANVVVDFADSACVLGSPGRLCQVFVNLLVNTAQAAEGAAAPVDLFVSTAQEGNRIVATVRDTGPGIPQGDLARLFDAFFTTKASGAGTGLGLAVTRQIVEEMGGTIRVESEVGKGATFTMTFAAARSAPLTQAPSRRTIDGDRMRLLFVDDEFPLLRCYERWFGRDHDVVTVQSPARVLEILRQQGDFTAIVSDVMMPGMTGPELYAQVNAEFPDLASRFVLVTGASGNADVRSWLAALPCPVFEKPIDVTALRATLLMLHHRRVATRVA
jgi:CheY-like chemotaxis protein